jgi:hypothetical protein
MGELRIELAQAEERLRQLELWRSESRQHSMRVQELWSLAEHAARRLPDMSLEERAQVLRALDVRVEVLDQGTKTPTVRIEGRVPHPSLLDTDSTGDLTSPKAPPDVPLRRLSGTGACEALP